MQDNHATPTAAASANALGKMTFVQYLLPPLRTGNFKVTVTQEVRIDCQVQETFEAHQAFFVTGERYALNPDDVNSVFPPAGLQGEFDRHLAHVVLNSPTLPWQRSPTGHGEKPVAGKPVATWLAVLLFDQDDPPPDAKTLTVADLKAGPETFFPASIPEMGEQLTDPVTVIDVPLPLFNAIAPSLADLNWTAHVRTVDSVAKPSKNGALPDLDYAVVFGNRLPEKGNISVAHLVSLENYGDYLPASDVSRSTHLPDTTTAVRLVTLKSWSFSTVNQQQTFTQLLTNLNRSPGALQLPYHAPGTAQSAADDAVKDAFGLGYTAMNHRLRDGSKTVSWYRGPLLPLPNPAHPTPPWKSADQLLRYDPSTGMLDVSYSAAWQVGRLLALHDSGFATALYRWKLTRTQEQALTLEQDIINQELQPITTSSGMLFASLPLTTAERAPQAHASARQGRLEGLWKGVVGLAAASLSNPTAEMET